MERRRSWWGWGWEDQEVSGTALDAIAAAVAARPGFQSVIVRNPPALDDLDLRAPRVEPPQALAGVCSSGIYERASHTYGKSFRDVVRALDGQLPNPPDVVAFPRTEGDVVALLDWCSSSNVAAIPYGGGSSVVGGVEAEVGDGYSGVVSIDLTAMDRVLEIDRTSRAARIQGGALGPVLEDQLRPEGYTLRHYPQSFEFSTLGGWLATRSGGHFATVYTHIDDLTESIRMVTPRGVTESRRLPGSGAGPSPDRLALGSEGVLGIITEAWMRLQERPRFKASASIQFATFNAAATACRAVSQSGLYPTNCRVLDGGEAASAGVTDGSSVLLLGFESHDHPLGAWIDRAVELCADHGGQVLGAREAPATSASRAARSAATQSETDSTAGQWRSSFLRAPYGRDAVARLGAIAETFETACTWDRFDELHARITADVGRALQEICGGGTISCRFTHVYPDGPAPYFTVLAPSRAGSQLSMWNEIKAAAGEALLACGGTITHHHAVGRDHRPWYDRQRPDLFAEALRAAKKTVDPAGILNPGVLLEP